MDFIKGADISMTRELEEHGAVYRWKGEEKDLFEILKLAGVNLIRLRLWNNPYSEEGEAYGGGTNDLKTVMELAKRAADQEIATMLDFHYSDFWADPAKQIKPKEWEGFEEEELEKAVYEYTKDTLEKLKRNGNLPAYVQVGNEITNGFLWPEGRAENTETMVRLLAAGIQAVRETEPKIQIMLHLDFGTDNELYRNWFGKIEKYHLDFDLIGMSYYPFWNGSLDLLIENMNDISSRFGKDIVVAETSIGYTTDPLGCTGVVFSEELEKSSGYPATQEGQAAFLKDLFAAVRTVKQERGRGIIYWEPGWLPIPECAWADPVGCVYMKDTAETGNSWGNQALFDRDGNANQALEDLKNM